MFKKTVLDRKGLTMIEVVTSLLMGSILVIALAVVLMDSQRGWNYTYNKSKEDIAIDDHVAKLRFDSVIREASAKNVSLGSVGEWVEVKHYASAASTELDRYSRLYVSGGSLMVEVGEPDPRTVLQTSTVCGNVTDCVFSLTGRSVQMALTLTEGATQKTVMSSAYIHNE